MHIDVLRNYIQSANLSFLIGSGLSLPFLTTLNKIEENLTKLGWKDDSGSNVIRASIYKEYFNKVIFPNICDGLTDDEQDKFDSVLNSYKKFLLTWNDILHRRCGGLLSKQVNIYTTNIDLFMERAAEETKVEFNDGFRGTMKPSFDESMFQKSVHKNSLYFQNSSELPSFNLLKIHGSINWNAGADGSINRDNDCALVKSVHSKLACIDSSLFVNNYDTVDEMQIDLSSRTNDEIQQASEEMCEFMNEYNKFAMVNPNKGKFSLTVTDSHFYELMRIYSNSLEKENSLLMVMGFSFADEHILNMTIRAAKLNPTLQVIIFAYEDNCAEGYREKFKGLANVLTLTPTELCKSNFDLKLNIAKFDFEGLNSLFEKVRGSLPSTFIYGHSK
jgi:hypothetical protein